MPQVTKLQLLPLPPQLLPLLPQLLPPLPQLLKLLPPWPQEQSTTNNKEPLSSNIKDSSLPVAHTHNNNNTMPLNNQLSTNRQPLLLQLLRPTLKFKSQLISELSLFSQPSLFSFSSSSLSLVSSANNSEDNNNTWLLHQKTTEPTRCQLKETSTECELNRKQIKFLYLNF